MTAAEEMRPLVEVSSERLLPLERASSAKVGLTNGRCIALLEANLEQHRKLLEEYKSCFVTTGCFFLTTILVDLVLADIMLLSFTLAKETQSLGILLLGSLFISPICTAWGSARYRSAAEDSMWGRFYALEDKTKVLIRTLQPFSHMLCDMRKMTPHFVALKVLGKQWKEVANDANPTQLSELFDALPPKALWRLQKATGDLFTDVIDVPAIGATYECVLIHNGQRTALEVPQKLVSRYPAVPQRGAEIEVTSEEEREDIVTLIGFLEREEAIEDTALIRSLYRASHRLGFADVEEWCCEQLIDKEAPSFFDSYLTQELAHRLIKHYWEKRQYIAVDWVLQQAHEQKMGGVIDTFQEFLKSQINAKPWDTTLLDVSLGQPKLYALIASIYCERINMRIFQKLCTHAETHIQIQNRCLQFYQEHDRSEIQQLWDKFEDFPLFLLTADLQALVIQ